MNLRDPSGAVNLIGTRCGLMNRILVSTVKGTKNGRSDSEEVRST
jgi:hypothetical protein